MSYNLCKFGIILILAVPVLGQVTFIDMASELGLSHHDDSRGVAVLDLDNDNISEIVIINKYDQNRLYKWADGVYAELAYEYGISETVLHHNITVADVDKDLNPDLYITGAPNSDEARYYLNLGYPPFQDMAEQYHIDDIVEMGSAFFQMTPSAGVSGLLGGRLMVREGDVFIDVTEGSGLETITNVLTPIFFDADGDIDDDLIIAGNYEDNRGRLFRNNADGTFTDISTNTNEGGFPVGQGVTVGDIDNDGDFDLYIASGFDYNSMWENDGTGFFTNITDRSNTGYDGYTRGVIMADFDNDCDLDLFLNRGTDTKMLLLNNGAGVFTDFSEQAGVLDLYNGMGCSASDLDNDGQVDIVAINCDYYPTDVYINQNQNSSFLKVKLIGQRKNSLALGAIIKLYGISYEPFDTTLIGIRHISSLTSMLSVDDLIAHFGTGIYENLFISVTFQSGENVIRDGLWPGQMVTVVEPMTDIEDADNQQLPEDYVIIDAYPNPFNNSVNITVSGTDSDNLGLSIYDMLGREVKSAQFNSDGSNRLTYIWECLDNHSQTVPSGVYFVKLDNGSTNTFKKITLLK